MAIGVSKELTKIGIEEEVTEGTFQAPQAATSYIQPLSDGFSITGSKELKDRPVLTSGFNAARPRVGKVSVEWSLNIEAKASGDEGEQPDWHVLAKNTLGGNRELAARVTSKTGHTVSRLEIEDFDISDLNIGDILLVLEAGAHHLSPIIAVDSSIGAAFVDLLVPAGSAFSDNVEIAKFQTYLGSNDQTDFKPLSLSFYHGNEILEKSLGSRPSTMALSNFTTGEIPSFDFSGGGIDFGREDASAPHTPTYDQSTPPLALSACVFVDGSQVDVNNFAFQIEHSNGELPSTCAASGVLSTRKTGKRAITGSFDPYLDDSDTALHEKFRANTAYSLFAYAANPGAVAGEYELGSVWAVYMPNNISTADSVADLDGIDITEIEFTADGGEAGDENEIYIGLI